MKYDILIIGSGISGLLTALHINQNLKIAVLAKNEINDGSTYQAQGGISAVFADDDSFNSHIEDTLTTGAGLCDPQVVERVVTLAPNAILNLQSLGVNFTKNNSGFHLGREGGHSHRRVVHAKDSTGKSISNTLSAQVANRKNIDIFTHHIAIDLITENKLSGSDNRVHGAYVLDIKQDKVVTFSAGAVVLATGGASKVYLYSSNPDGSTGDGIAMAWRAGCKVSNMEFNQFHPTCLYHPHAKSFLISEAVRGEGGILTLPDGTRFMQQIDKRQELASRDIVARAIDNQMKRLGIESVYLDISFKPKDFIEKNFPKISSELKKYGFDLSQTTIPVVPAAHYTCGGIVVDLQGQTSIEGLYAVGETTCTGLHGANRMASNSLLECAVFAKSVADEINCRNFTTAKQLPQWDESQVVNSDEMVVVSHNWDELRRFMWDYVGIVRTNKRLQRAKHRVALLQSEISDYYSNFKVHSHLLELRNLVQVAEIMVDFAIARQESRGLHYNLDYPEQLPTAKSIVKSLADDR